MFAGRLSVSGHGAQDDRCCGVRQNRVVLASVADVKLPVANLIQPDRSAIKPAAMEAKGIRLQGELGISRQTIAQGMPACSGCTCMLVCASIYILHTRPRVQQAPGIPCSLSLGDKVDGKTRTLSAARTPTHIPCHHPRKRMRVIQYSRDANDRIEKPRRTGCPAFARALQKSDGMILFSEGFAGGTDGGASDWSVELYGRAGE